MDTKNDYKNVIRPSNYLDYRQYLKDIYDYFKHNHSNYSYKKFSSDLGFSASTLLHQIVKGYRPLTIKNGQKIAENLNIEGNEKRYFLELIHFCNVKTNKERDVSFNNLLKLKNDLLIHEVDKQWLEFFSEWQHSVIREIISLNIPARNSEDILSLLGPKLKKDEVSKSLDLLEKLHLICKNENKPGWKQTSEVVSTGPEIQSMALSHYHKQMIEHGIQALFEVDGSMRDISSMTLTVDEEQFLQIKKLIHDFQQKVLLSAQKSKLRDKVIQLNIQLFPFTKI